MTILSSRCHDIENKIITSSSSLWLIEDELATAKEENRLINIDRLILLINKSIEDFKVVEKGFKFVKKIAGIFQRV